MKKFFQAFGFVALTLVIFTGFVAGAGYVLSQTGEASQEFAEAFYPSAQPAVDKPCDGVTDEELLEALQLGTPLADTCFVEPVLEQLRI